MKNSATWPRARKRFSPNDLASCTSSTGFANILAARTKSTPWAWTFSMRFCVSHSNTGLVSGLDPAADLNRLLRPVSGAI
jgi:hypothetical protein